MEKGGRKSFGKRSRSESMSSEKPSGTKRLKLPSCMGSSRDIPSGTSSRGMPSSSMFFTRSPSDDEKDDTADDKPISSLATHTGKTMNFRRPLIKSSLKDSNYYLPAYHGGKPCNIPDLPGGFSLEPLLHALQLGMAAQNKTKDEVTIKVYQLLRRIWIPDSPMRVSIVGGRNIHSMAECFHDYNKYLDLFCPPDMFDIRTRSHPTGEKDFDVCEPFMPYRSGRQRKICRAVDLAFVDLAGEYAIRHCAQRGRKINDVADELYMSAERAIRDGRVRRVIFLPAVADDHPTGRGYQQTYEAFNKRLFVNVNQRNDSRKCGYAGELMRVLSKHYCYEKDSPDQLSAAGIYTLLTFICALIQRYALEERQKR